MHEFGIAQAILQATIDVAKAHESRPVERVKVRIGRLRQIVPDSLTFAFEALAKDTVVAGAVLEYEIVPPRLRCKKCAAEYAPEEDWLWQCPKCGESKAELLQGEELLLETVVLRDGDS
ncbi:MAG TPA: hydrogenase maturation nickel metallochaperone HypA [Planctomycetota bacterium]|jgi:hydrogenase nickel incorporation protein HypA/HybF